ncbi:MAG: CinA family protein [bacterium]
MAEERGIKNKVDIEDFFSKVIAAIGRTTDKEVAELLVKKHKTLGTAESITGGLLAGRITDMAGSSEYFMGGVVTYTNRTKVMELNIAPALIAEYGAVSSEIAIAMAEAIRKKWRIDIGLATTGVAGPGGVNPPQPIGKAYIAVSSVEGSEFKELNLRGSRREIREKAVQGALGLLWMHLGGDEVRRRFEGID